MAATEFLRTMKTTLLYQFRSMAKTTQFTKEHCLALSNNPNYPKKNSLNKICQYEKNK